MLYLWTLQKGCFFFFPGGGHVQAELSKQVTQQAILLLRLSCRSCVSPGTPKGLMGLEYAHIDY